MTDPPYNDRMIREAVEACWKALADLTVEQKAAALDALYLQFEMEIASHDPAAAPGRQH